MKRLLIIFSLLISIATYSQGEKNFYLGVSTGAGATFEQFKYKIDFTNDVGQVLDSTAIKLKVYGYHIPVCVPILFGSGKWRIGLNIYYEYIRMVRWKSPGYEIKEGNFILQYAPVNRKVNITYHLFKAGVLFEYDFLTKKKFALGLTTELGYYYLAKTSYGYEKAPFLYGSLGLQSSYSLCHGLQLLYGASIDVQGFVRNFGDKENHVFFQPRLTIGIRKAIALKPKKKKS